MGAPSSLAFPNTHDDSVCCQNFNCPLWFKFDNDLPCSSKPQVGEKKYFHCPSNTNIGAYGLQLFDCDNCLCMNFYNFIWTWCSTTINYKGASKKLKICKQLRKRMFGLFHPLLNGKRYCSYWASDQSIFPAYPM